MMLKLPFDDACFQSEETSANITNNIVFATPTQTLFLSILENETACQNNKDLCRLGAGVKTNHIKGFILILKKQF